MSQIHSFPPIVSDASRVLILGTMPGIVSLKAGEYYAHPRNAFWSIMGELFGASPALSYEARTLADKVQAWSVVRQALAEGLPAAARPRRSGFQGTGSG
jgi:TDG/mug DNA glycosylase family protein